VISSRSLGQNSRRSPSEKRTSTATYSSPPYLPTTLPIMPRRSKILCSWRTLTFVPTKHVLSIQNIDMGPDFLEIVPDFSELSQISSRT
jgi:hypothetical protein